MFEVRKGVPAPVGKSRLYPFDQMDVGDHFDAPDDMGKLRDGKSARGQRQGVCLRLGTAPQIAGEIPHPQDRRCHPLLEDRMNWETVIRECARTDEIFGMIGCGLLLLALPFIAAAAPEPVGMERAQPANISTGDQQRTLP